MTKLSLAIFAVSLLGFGVAVCPAQTRRELVLQSGPVAPVVALAFSPDGRFLAGASTEESNADRRFGGLKLWDARTGELVRDFAGPVQSLKSLAFSRDGSLLASADGRAITLWNPRNGRVVRTLSAPQGVSEVLWLPDGTLVGSQGAIVWRWKGATGAATLLGRAKDEFFFDEMGEQSPLQSDVRGTRLTLRTSHRITIWNPNTGQQIRVLPLPQEVESLTSPALSPDGSRLASLLRDENGSVDAVQIWDLGTGKAIAKWKIERSPSSIRYSADGQFLLASDPGQDEIRWHDARNGKITRRLKVVPNTGGINALALARDGLTFATGSYFNPTVQIWRGDKATVKAIVPAIQTPNAVQTLFFAPQGQTLVWGQDNGALYFWDLASGAMTHFLDVHRGDEGTNISDAAFSPDGARLFVAEGNELLCLDATTGKPVRPAQKLGDFSETHLALSPDGNLLATAGMNQLLRLWNAQTGGEIVFREPLTFKRRESNQKNEEETAYTRKWSTNALSFSPDGKRLAMGGTSNSRLRIFDVEKREVEREIDTFSGDFVAFSPDGRQLIAIDQWSDELEVFEVGSGRKIWKASPVCGATFTAGGELWCRERGGFLSLRDAGSGEIKRRFASEARDDAPDLHPDTPRAWLVASPDGRFLIGKSSDETVKIWDAASGTLRVSFFNPPLPDRMSPHWLAFTPEGFYNGSAGIEHFLRWRSDATVDKGEKWRSTFSNAARVKAALSNP